MRSPLEECRQESSSGFVEQRRAGTIQKYPRAASQGASTGQETWAGGMGGGGVPQCAFPRYKANAQQRLAATHTYTRPRKPTHFI